MSLATDRGKLQQADKPTLYKQIRLDIERRILTGEWPPGHRIPFTASRSSTSSWRAMAARE